MLAIRLTRIGKKNSPAYRVVVADKRRAVKRKFIEILGNYNPTSKPKQVVISKDRAIFWMNVGAQPSDTVRNLMADLGILKKSDKVNKIYGKKKIEEKKTEVVITPKTTAAEVVEEKTEVLEPETEAPAKDSIESEVK